MRKTRARLAILGILTGTSSAFGLEPAPAAAVPPRAPPEKAPSPADAPVPDPAPGGEPSPGDSSSQAPPDAAPAEPAPTPTATPGVAPRVNPPSAGENSEPTILPARDTVGRHLAVGAMVGLFVPFGSVDSSVAQSDVIGSGLLLGGDITYGVSRTVMVGAYGEVAMPSGAGPWSGQSVSSIGAGPMLRYHLVQGTRFDPWLSYGVGLRRLSSGNDSYTGIDWARLQLGGDWYMTSGLGIGPLLELSMGTFIDSSGNLESKAVNAEFVLGARLVFDSPGK